MGEKNYNLSRWFVHHEIVCFHVLLLSLVCSSTHAQSSTGQEANQYELYTKFDPSMAILVIVLICVVFFAGMFSIFIRHCTDSSTGASNSIHPNAAAGNQARRIGLEPAEIEKFPIVMYSAVKQIKIGREVLECAVCLSEFDDDETLRLLPKCNHVFHPECIDAWLASHVTCPVCRANLIPESHTKNSPQQATTTNSNNQESTVPESREIQGEVAITVNDEQSREPQVTVTPDTSQARNRPPRSGISGKFPRSHSTGHSLVQPGENIERYTLRLPEEVRRQIMESAKAKLHRTTSFNVVLAGEGSWSSKKGYRSGGEDSSSRGRQIGRPDWWVFLMTPPFVSKGGSVKSFQIDNDGDSSNGRTLLASVKVPLNCLNMRGDGVEASSGRARPLV